MCEKRAVNRLSKRAVNSLSSGSLSGCHICGDEVCSPLTYQPPCGRCEGAVDADDVGAAQKLLQLLTGRLRRGSHHLPSKCGRMVGRGRAGCSLQHGVSPPELCSSVVVLLECVAHMCTA